MQRGQTQACPVLQLQASRTSQQPGATGSRLRSDGLYGFSFYISRTFLKRQESGVLVVKTTASHLFRVEPAGEEALTRVPPSGHLHPATSPLFAYTRPASPRALASAAPPPAHPTRENATRLLVALGFHFPPAGHGRCLFGCLQSLFSHLCKSPLCLCWLSFRPACPGFRFSERCGSNPHPAESCRDEAVPHRTMGSGGSWKPVGAVGEGRGGQFSLGHSERPPGKP